MALANWARSETAYPSHRNDVAVVHRSARSTGDVSEAVDSDLHDACRSVAERWQGQLDANCTTLIRPPFVMMSDLPTAEVARHYVDIVSPTNQSIESVYVNQVINEPVVVMLFSNEATYRRYARRLFAQKHASVYGFYNPATRTVVVNVESGLGTLVHELTHAIFDFDFEQMPLWLNEGIASLHEQATFSNDGSVPSIVGNINWRYPILKDAIVAGELGSLRDLLKMQNAFRGEQEGVHYAQARYFCMYLQQKNKLVSLYKRLRDGDHVSSVDCVSELFDEASWTEIDRDFSAWTLQLTSSDDSRSSAANATE